jgi:hypothetical protein
MAATRELHLSVKMIGRSGGRSPVAAASYCSGQKLKDERQGMTWKYRHQEEILANGIIAPTDAPEWATDRARLWNEVDRAEKRKDAQTARLIDLALPHELSLSDNIGLLDEFMRNQFVERGMVADWSIHRPDKEGDQRNIHAHIMLTTREIGPDGFGKKARDWNDKALLQEWRGQWAEMQNQALAAQGIGVRIEHRSFKVRGIDKEPHVHEGPKVAAMAQRGQKASRSHGRVERMGPWASKGQKRPRQVFDFSRLAGSTRADINRSRTVSNRERYTKLAERMEWHWRTYKVPLHARETFINFCMVHGSNNGLGTVQMDPERFGSLRRQPPQEKASVGQNGASGPYSVAPPLPQDGGRGDTTAKKGSSPSADKGRATMAKPEAPKDVQTTVTVSLDLTAMEKEIEAPKRGLLDTKHARHERAAILLRGLFINRYGADKHQAAMHKFVWICDSKGFVRAVDKLRHFPRELGPILPHVKDISAKTRREERRRHAAARAEEKRRLKSELKAAKAPDQARQVPEDQAPKKEAPGPVKDTPQKASPKPKKSKVWAKLDAKGPPPDKEKLARDAREKEQQRERDELER